MSLELLENLLYKEIPYMLFYRDGRFAIVNEFGTYIGDTLEEAIQDLVEHYDEDESDGGDDDNDDPDGGQFGADGPDHYPPLRLVAGGKA